MALDNQGARQASVRAVTGTLLDYNSDWEALFDLVGIPVNRTWNERLLLWINGQLGTSYANISDAMQAFAASQSYYDWSSMGDFSVGGAPPGFILLIDPDGAYLTDPDGAYLMEPV